VTVHAKDTLARHSVAEVFDLLLAVPALEAVGAICTVSSHDGKIFDLVLA
jgi:hypothetical protein